MEPFFPVNENSQREFFDISSGILSLRGHVARPASKILKEFKKINRSIFPNQSTYFKLYNVFQHSTFIPPFLYTNTHRYEQVNILK